MESERLLRLHESKVRLLRAGWEFEESCDDDGHVYYVSAALNDCFEHTAHRYSYADALDAAIKWASHTQLRLENTEP